MRTSLALIRILALAGAAGGAQQAFNRRRYPCCPARASAFVHDGKIQKKQTKTRKVIIMAAITEIDVRIKTADERGAGTDGDIYLAIDGREFHIDSALDDFERGDDRVYTLGVNHNINFPSNNDPQKDYVLDTEDLDNFPVWIRFEPSGSFPHWKLEEVTVTVNPGPGQVQYQALADSNSLWLGQQVGKFCFLKKVLGIP
jgi:hypothetical protein